MPLNCPFSFKIAYFLPPNCLHIAHKLPAFFLLLVHVVPMNYPHFEAPTFCLYSNLKRSTCWSYCFLLMHFADWKCWIFRILCAHCQHFALFLFMLPIFGHISPKCGQISALNKRHIILKLNWRSDGIRVREVGRSYFKWFVWFGSERHLDDVTYERNVWRNIRNIDSWPVRSRY